MPVQATIIVSGTVQSVGYREDVHRQATRLGLTGLVQNLDDGSVCIVVEGEKKKIDEFVGAVGKSDRLAEVTDINVEFSESKGCFGSFIVARDMKRNGLPESKMEEGIGYLKQIVEVLESMKKDTGERMVEQGAKTDSLGDKIDATGSKIDKLGDKIDQSGSKLDRVGDKIDELGAKTDKLGDNLAGKIDGLGDKLNDTLGGKIETMDVHMGEHFGRLDVKYDKFGDKLDEISKDMKVLSGDIREMKMLFSTFVNHFLEKDKANA
jgi:acylphosphatase